MVHRDLAVALFREASSRDFPSFSPNCTIITDEVTFNAFEFFFTDKNLRGSMYGSSNVRTFMPKLLRLWRQGKLDLESMITRRIQLDDVNDAFKAMEAGEVIRSVIEYK